MLGNVSLFCLLPECSNVGNVGNVKIFYKITHPQNVGNAGNVGNVTECDYLLSAPWM